MTDANTPNSAFFGRKMPGVESGFAGFSPVAAPVVGSTFVPPAPVAPAAEPAPVFTPPPTQAVLESEPVAPVPVVEAMPTAPEVPATPIFEEPAFVSPDGYVPPRFSDLEKADLPPAAAMAGTGIQEPVGVSGIQEPVGITGIQEPVGVIPQGEPVEPAATAEVPATEVAAEDPEAELRAKFEMIPAEARLMLDFPESFDALTDDQKTTLSMVEIGQQDTSLAPEQQAALENLVSALESDDFKNAVSVKARVQAAGLNVIAKKSLEGDSTAYTAFYNESFKMLEKIADSIPSTNNIVADKLVELATQLVDSGVSTPLNVAAHEQAQAMGAVAQATGFQAQLAMKEQMQGHAARVRNEQAKSEDHRSGVYL